MTINCSQCLEPETFVELKAPTYALSGRVHVDTGEPGKGDGLRGFRVDVENTQPGEARRWCLTDELGRWRVSELPAGSYRVRVASRAFFAPAPPAQGFVVTLPGESKPAALNFALRPLPGSASDPGASGDATAAPVPSVPETAPHDDAYLAEARRRALLARKLTIELSVDENLAVLKLAGQTSTESAEALGRAVAQIIAMSPRRTEIELSRLEMITSIGIGQLNTLVTELHRQGKVVVILNPKARILEVLRRVRLDATVQTSATAP